MEIKYFKYPSRPNFILQSRVSTGIIFTGLSKKPTANFTNICDICLFKLKYKNASTHR